MPAFGKPPYSPKTMLHFVQLQLQLQQPKIFNSIPTALLTLSWVLSFVVTLICDEVCVALHLLRCGPNTSFMADHDFVTLPLFHNSEKMHNQSPAFLIQACSFLCYIGSAST